MSEHDKDEWGNIPLPGLSDEELFNTNWNMVAACQERSKTDWLKNNKKSTKDPNRNSKISKTLKSKNLTMSEEKKKYLSDLHKGKLLSNELKAHLSEIKQGENNPMFGRHHSDDAKKKMGEKNSKAIMTPAGEFQSQTAAAKYYGVKQPDIFYRIKTNPTEYYYLNKEK